MPEVWMYGPGFCFAVLCDFVTEFIRKDDILETE